MMLQQLAGRQVHGTDKRGQGKGAKAGERQRGRGSIVIIVNGSSLLIIWSALTTKDSRAHMLTGASGNTDALRAGKKRTACGVLRMLLLYSVP